MDEFSGLLARDFGFRSQRKAASLAARRTGIGNSMSGIETTASARSSIKPGRDSPPPRPVSISDTHDDVFYKQSSSQDYSGCADVLGGPSLHAHSSDSRNTSSSSPVFSYDSIFHDSEENVKSSSLPVYDKPVYDDDIFEGLPGLRSSASTKFDEVFPSKPSSHAKLSPYDDLLENFGRGETIQNGSSAVGVPEMEMSPLDDLIPGFGAKNDSQSIGVHSKDNQTSPSPTTSSTAVENPFVILEPDSVPPYSSSEYRDPLQDPSKTSKSSKPLSSSVDRLFDKASVFNEMTDDRKEKSFIKEGRDGSVLQNVKVSTEKLYFKNSHHNATDTMFKMPIGSTNPSRCSDGREYWASSNVNSVFPETSSHPVTSPKSNRDMKNHDVWLTVSDVPLLTQPTTAPPPARLPPRPPVSKGEFNAMTKAHDSSKLPSVSSIEELEDFVMARPSQMHNDEANPILFAEGNVEPNLAAAASATVIKEAMDKAEAKFKHAKEVREREKDAKIARGRESARADIIDEAAQDALGRENQEKLVQVTQEKEQREREQKEKDEKEREKRKMEKEERERTRLVVEMAAREARERAAAEARLRAEHEARVRAEREVVHRAAAEARERAAADAKRRAEREAREKAEIEAREKAVREAKEKEERDMAAAERAAAERAAFERAASEVRRRAERAAVERVQAEARERAAAAAREKQKRNESDLESFFSMSSRPNSEPKQRASTPDPFDTQFQSRNSENIPKTSVRMSSMRKASSTTNIADDLSSIFGAVPTSDEFQDIEGETEERRRARLERHQRTLERAQKALAEKNERDIQIQREQAERHRIAETLDVEIKRWAAGKEGNLRALLSTLQYVLWPECGWQPVSLTDLIIGSSVKKVYRKATLCVHPDKVQQKGATLHQKYIAEKVFDLLKEAWNKFNSEELF